MKDRQKIAEALEGLKSLDYQTGMFIMDTLRGEKVCYTGVLSQSAFDIHGHLCSAVPLYWRGNAQEIIDAFVEAGKGNFGIDWDGLTSSPLFINPAISLAKYKKYKPGRPAERTGTYQRITLEVREDLLASMDSKSISRRDYIEQLLERDGAIIL